MTPRIAAIVCTHNRAQILEGAIENLLAQTLPPEQYEIVVIDNASTDDTKATVHRFADATVNVRYAFEPRLGIAPARSRGALEATAPYLAFTDDDALPASDWLETILDVFDKEPRRPLGITGRIELRWAAKRPFWLPDGALLALGSSDYGNAAHACTYPSETMLGANMAIDRTFVLANAFDARLGRVGLRLTGNEDTEMSARVLDHEGLVLYDPRMRIQHIVSRERLRLRWLLPRYFSQGISDVVLEQIRSAPPAPSSRRIARRLWRSLRAPSFQSGVMLLLSGAYVAGRISRLLRRGNVAVAKQAAATETGGQRLA